ncbi:peptide-methionine (R)-S-oxide reductase [Erysipelotrichaceae bacterium OH741_COT-311]|nr:peptide-methionine (R)-S-oxide reductase [Erysipelotrichaceae bacterium OH741_COT-311]
MLKKEIYLAGGCFWGIEKLASKLHGVIEAYSGYANGDTPNPTYQEVCQQHTGYKETVQVIYDSEKTNLESILASYFYVIDPTVKHRQGNDIGPQYQTGIYYHLEDEANVLAYVQEYQKDIVNFSVEVEPLRNFYKAEEYHQKYLTKNPDGYCHLSNAKIEEAAKLRVYKKDLDTIKKLDDEAFKVTQLNGTEYPFTGKYYEFDEKGIYVDIVSKEPLFSSLDKYHSSCGWPAFTKPIEQRATKERMDTSCNMIRTEVRSRFGDSHLGHVFTMDPESPNQIRYCINSASLLFIPYDKLEEEGYGQYKHLFEK